MRSHCCALSLPEKRRDRVTRGWDGTRQAELRGRGMREAQSLCVMGSGENALKRPKLAINNYWVLAKNLPGDPGVSVGTLGCRGTRISWGKITLENQLSELRQN